jgi:hypothetical protein
LSGYTTLPDFLAIITLKEAWIPWHSYPKTLDWIVESALYFYPVGGDPHDYAIAVDFEITSPALLPVVHLRNVGSSAQNYYFELEHEPTDYWNRMGWGGRTPP